MKRIRAVAPKIRRERRWPENLPADPRDPDVVRAKALAPYPAGPPCRTQTAKVRLEETRHDEPDGTGHSPGHRRDRGAGRGRAAGGGQATRATRGAGTEPAPVPVTADQGQPRPAVTTGAHDGAVHQMAMPLHPPGRPARAVEQAQHIFHELHADGRNALCVVCDNQYGSPSLRVPAPVELPQRPPNLPQGALSQGTEL
jgi:hypothetical protein